MNYQFLVGRAIDLNGQGYVVDALDAAHGRAVVHAVARIAGEQVMRTFPAELALRALVADEEIELRGVSFA